MALVEVRELTKIYSQGRHEVRSEEGVSLDIHSG